MKKVKITVNPGSHGKTLTLFQTPNDALTSLVSIRDGSSFLGGIDSGPEHITLSPGEFIEAEWYGCEYDHSRPDSLKTDLVRGAKAVEAKNAGGLVVAAFQGWTINNAIPFCEFKDADISVTVVSKNDKQIDVSALFNELSNE